MAEGISAGLFIPRTDGLSRNETMRPGHNECMTCLKGNQTDENTLAGRAAPRQKPAARQENKGRFRNSTGSSRDVMRKRGCSANTNTLNMSGKAQVLNLYPPSPQQRPRRQLKYNSVAVLTVLIFPTRAFVVSFECVMDWPGLVRNVTTWEGELILTDSRAGQ
ncbi:hypothetical protein Q8A73_011455 [Channa argus]|nr:hypothetical protein Q8A73_011455 [Channa argus]